MVASEASAFHQYVNNYIVLKDHDVLEVQLTPSGEFVYNKSLLKYPKQIKTAEVIHSSPEPWPYWMIKEIREQPQAVLRAMNNGARISSATTVKLGGLDSCRELLIECEHLILLGCGTSFHAGLWSLDLFKSLYIFNTVVLYDGADFSSKDIPLKGKTAVVLLSQSGETKDLQRCIQIIQEKGLVSIGVVNVIDSFIARETNCGVYLNAGREVAVASTKSFTNKCVVLSLLAVWFSQNLGTCEEKRRKIISDLHQLPIQMSNVFTKENEEKIRILVNGIRTTKSMFLLGKGKDEAIAKEGALKLKEIARIHAEGYSTSALKHGPFGLLEGGMPVIVMDIGEKYREKTASSIEEIKAREADIYLLRDNSEESFFIFESNMTFGSLLANVCLQWVSYEYAVINGFSPDYPRNLAKVVTVE
jgi:glucosamine--fructose-6-phosphate aminotransferase (isomerizing)